ncbi:hypothetical protein ABTY61_04040 [Kitasatospora sp. NPDC096128]|uniref:hypothetical protein n=1 Tax=Kitasatospora sp. NPDC096128 TaxID=3155547 RepID=UPI0033221E5B
MNHPNLPTTQAAVPAVEAVAARHGRAVRAEHDIGGDRTFAGLVGAGAVGPDGEPGAVPHEALLEFDGSPRTAVRLFTHDEAVVTVEGIAFDVPRDSVPAFLHSVWSDLVHVKVRTFPPSSTLIVTVPGEPSYREALGVHDLTPWLSGKIR